ncbi:MAG TPA: ATP-binding protein [Kofleriaceae bacterium]|nr:ATP-binding protein [Kofleriaceae bacterium]
MPLPFVNRHAELGRLRRALTARTSSLVCVYGRRRVGKSRLVTTAIEDLAAVYYLADERDDHLQRRSLAREIERLIPGFARVEYRDWDALLDRWADAAPPGAVLALDELPYLVRAAPSLPSILQRRIDRGPGRQHLVVCGSSQRMMHGIVLDAAAPLYGRAREILKVEPLLFPYLPEALRLRRAEDAVEAYATWGGIPRYWELADGADSLQAAQRDLVLDPLGVLHAEPQRLLLDELSETMQAHSILALIGQGCHRLSEIAGRLGRPATSLSRPLAVLADIGLVKRELPFGEHPRRSKRARYRIADPFLRYWYRFVDPNRSLLEARQLDVQTRTAWLSHLAECWEEIVRASIPDITIDDARWQPAQPWWGGAGAGPDAEIDIVAAHRDDRTRLLVGEAKLSLDAAAVPRLLHDLEAKARSCEWARNKQLAFRLWTLRWQGRTRRPSTVIDARELQASWREAVGRAEP